MSTTRRDFTKLMGAALVAPIAGSGAGFSLWERAEAEVQEAGLPSPETTRTLLDNQGVRGVFEDEAEFEELRRALARKIRDHRIVREFPVPADIEPILNFEA